MIPAKASKPKLNLWRGMTSIVLLLLFCKSLWNFFRGLYSSDSFIRVEEYIKTGKDKNIVNPDPNGLYTKWKQQRIGIGAASSVADGDAHNKEHLTVKYPTDGWSTSLERMPMFTRAEMNEHIARSGKNISDIQNHSVPTSLRNAYYAQVQGQIGVTGAKWCDFITYTSKGIYIEWIAFNPACWENLKTELLRYYFEHFFKFAAADFKSSA